MTDQQHIDALSEPVKDALLEDLEHASKALRDDLLRRAEWDGECKAVCVGNGAWIRFNEALNNIAIPKPSPKRDPVEELEDEMLEAWLTTQTGSKSWAHFAIRYLIERGILDKEGRRRTAHV